METLINDTPAGVLWVRIGSAAARTVGPAAWGQGEA